MATYLVQGSETLISDETVESVKSSLTYCGSGVSRSVYFLDANTVLKVDKGSTGFGCNSTEVEAYENADEEERKYLAKPIAYGKGWIVQERVCCVGEYCENCWDENINGSWEEEFDRMYSVCNYLGIRDIHDGNYGTVNGRVIAIDYAANQNHGNAYGSYEGDHEDCENQSCCWLCNEQDSCCAQHSNCFASSFCGDCASEPCCAEDCYEDAVVRITVTREAIGSDFNGAPMLFPTFDFEFYCGKHDTPDKRRNTILADVRDDAAHTAALIKTHDAKMWERAGQLRMFGNMSCGGRVSIERMLAHCDIPHCCNGLTFYELCDICLRRANARIAAVVCAPPLPWHRRVAFPYAPLRTHAEIAADRKRANHMRRGWGMASQF